MATAETRLQLLTAIAACEEKKAEDVRVLELDPADAGLADFFLIASATNDRQVVAIADEIELRLKREFGLFASSVEGRRQGEWILLDYVDIVIHVFLAEKRAFYDIERLRKSARNLTGTEAEKELRSALARKTRAVRTGTAPGQNAPKQAGLAKKADSKLVKGEREVAKKAVKKAAKKAAKKAPVKAPAKKAVKKAAKKTPAKKAAAVKAVAKKAPAKKAPAKKAAAVKAVAKKAVAKKAPVKAAPVKSAVKKAAVKTSATPGFAARIEAKSDPTPVVTPIEPVPMPPPAPPGSGGIEPQGPVKPPVVKEG